MPGRGRPARLPHGRCRMRCPIFGRDAPMARPPPGVRHLAAPLWSCLLLPLLGVSEFWRTGGFSRKGRKGTQKTRNPVKFVVSYCHETLTPTTRCRSLSRGRLRPFQASWVSIFRTCQKISPLQKSGISHGSRGENRFVLLSWHVASIRSDKCDNLDR